MVYEFVRGSVFGIFCDVDKNSVSIIEQITIWTINLMKSVREGELGDC